ncbi:plasmid partitioning protein RepB C-terminal domain-containing protein [Paraburkholderia sp. C35]|uniref:plasmid partitioning protein RepB C-terminal domain-containing protein n=1 Tax=Paraburkholderia sp. C35 TaxID=2126993 RepID=UPI0013A58AD6|nr:plasmid partitioning protein RepB C-terminal domain-containing protein [Paraburkholderia sp. C35]
MNDSLGPIIDIPLEQIRILNPRGRGRKQHRAITGSIASVGLKRPITVSRRKGNPDGTTYNLVCGQGRMEAVQALGHKTIPARVIDCDEVGCLEMSLVENVARRNHTALELLRDVEALVKSGESADDVAAKVGLSVSYLQSLLALLEHGEERLVAAVEQGSLPVGLAISISRATDTEVQLALANAYADGTLRGRQLAIVRRIMEQRQKSRGCPPGGVRAPMGREALTPDKLRKLYIRESEKQALLLRKADVVRARLSVLTATLKSLTGNPEFVKLLHAENLASMPRVLADRLEGVKP